jgi:hypothetical protein
VVGYGNYLLVWGSIYEWGFTWADGTWTRVRWRPWALAVGGATLLAGLVTSRAFEADIVGSGNADRPSIALLAYAAALAGLVLTAGPRGPLGWQQDAGGSQRRLVPPAVARAGKLG